MNTTVTGSRIAMESETKFETVKALAGIGSGVCVSVWTMDNLVALCTIVYLIASTGLLLPKYKWFQNLCEKLFARKDKQ